MGSSTEQSPLWNVATSTYVDRSGHYDLVKDLGSARTVIQLHSRGLRKPGIFYEPCPSCHRGIALVALSLYVGTAVESLCLLGTTGVLY